jgi:signal transduction histidine kinase
MAVRDRGPGVPEAFRELAFEKFSQADGSDTRASGGTGLGLAISKELVEHMGGSIGYEPGEGGGAVFFVDLPLASGR